MTGLDTPSRLSPPFLFVYNNAPYKPERNTIKIFWLSLACLLILVAYFWGEKIFIERCRRRVPLRVAVTGTRGKSAVARLVAAALRGAGHRVVARTTGSRPAVILPDGSEQEIERKGSPSLLEGKALLHLARKLKADTVVAELMSINPEYLAVEAGRIFRPSVLALTNVRLDHLDVMGRTKEEIARSLASAIPSKCLVFIPKEECLTVFEEKAKKAGSRLIKVPLRKGGPAPAGRLYDFPENTCLALAVAGACGVSERTARKAMAGARPDLGALRAWKVRFGRPSGVWWCLSAFAANDPESTSVIMAKLRSTRFLQKGRRLLLLNLREDRPDRTRQWLEAAGQGYFREFDRLAVSGAPRALQRRLAKIQPAAGPPLTVVSDKDPMAVMNNLLGKETGGGLLVGVGNIGGLGRSLIELWERIGEASD
jgi:poly-gamma-glutamate synthase PgsB/CapB